MKRDKVLLNYYHTDRGSANTFGSRADFPVRVSRMRDISRWSTSYTSDINTVTH